MLYRRSEVQVNHVLAKVYEKKTCKYVCVADTHSSFVQAESYVLSKLALSKAIRTDVKEYTRILQPTKEELQKLDHFKDSFLPLWEFHDNSCHVDSTLVLCWCIHKRGDPSPFQKAHSRVGRHLLSALVAMDECHKKV